MHHIRRTAYVTIFWNNGFVFVEAASCPQVEGVDVQEADGLLQQFLCVPSQNSTDFLRWICSRYSQPLLLFCHPPFFCLLLNPPWSTKKFILLCLKIKLSIEVHSNSRLTWLACVDSPPDDVGD